MSLSTTCRPISSIQGFSLMAGQTSLYLKIPVGTELSVMIPTVGGLSGGTITVDYTQSVDEQVISSPSTAVWTNAARTYTVSVGVVTGTLPVKIGQNCWLRFNCVSGSGAVSLDPSGTLANYTGDPFSGLVQQDPVSGVSYNGSNQVTGYQLGGVTYAVTYPAGQIVVSGSDSSVKTITLDGSGRIAAVAGS